MLLRRVPAQVCPFCEARSILSTFRQQPRTPSWQHSRPMSQLQRKRPQRMILEPRVDRSPRKVAPSGKPRERPGMSPFGAMNRTNVPMGLEAEKSRRLRTDGRPPRTTISPKTSPAASKKRRDRTPGEMRALKMQQALSTVPYGQRSALKSRISQMEEFEQFPLLPTIQRSLREDILRGLDDITPTPIQRLAIPALLGMDHRSRRSSSTESTAKGGMQEFLLAAETGSGKTLAYALPVIDAIKRAEAAEAAATEAEEKVQLEKPKPKTNPFELESPPLSNDPHDTSGRPRAIILLPTSELVEQTGAVFKRLSHITKLRVSLISADYTATVIRNRLFGPAGIDVLISTPHLITSIAQSDPNILSRVSHLVVDEADSLLDRSFAPLTSAVLDRATPSLKQLILCSATIPRSLNSYLESRFPNIIRLATPNLHAIPRRVQLQVVDIEPEPYRGNRDLACADAIWNIGRENVSPAEKDEVSGAAPAAVKRIIVFVNEREKAPELAEYLVKKGVDAVALNRDTKEQRRGDALAAFTSLELPSAGPGSTNANPSPPPRHLELRASDRRAGHTAALDQRANATASTSRSSRTLANTKVLVTTDIGARGIDTVAVRTVILYDVPYTSIDFIHRLGRVGRMGRRGRGFVLVGKGDRRDVVREVREGMFRGQALI